jgi:hypothetical protein
LRPPWAHHVVVYLVSPETGQKYVFASATVGAHIAYDRLKEQVVVMRKLKGAQCVPIVELSSRPMRTRFKKNAVRPHLETIGWKTPGALSQSASPQIENRNAAAETLAAMGSVEEPTAAELVDDEIPEL